MKIENPSGKITSLTFSPFSSTSHDQSLSSGDDGVKVSHVARVNGPQAGIEGVWVSFNEWWDATVIKDNNGSMFSRRDLVLAHANKDRGAHVDPKLDEPYANLSRFNSMGWILESDGIQRMLENSVVAPSIRQIAYEVLVSLKQTITTEK